MSVVVQPGHAEVAPGYVRAVWPMAAGALITDEDGRVLLVNPTYHTGEWKDRWLFPGGGMDQGDDGPAATCAREVSEELGLEWPVGDLLAVDWIPQDGRFFEEMIFVFDGGVMDEAARARVRLPEDDELAGFQFFPLAEAMEKLAAPDARRLEQAVAARGRNAGPVLLRYGRPRS
ncbi:NUDIX domain-containing protein [Kitasatospora cineracea]|uniref:NUDIX domain-containing protein n=1 Tax=Kitasatospora cineracea TaxID=88074 RepID=UPI0037F6C0B6